jgi:hypothetical protein
MTYKKPVAVMRGGVLWGKDTFFRILFEFDHDLLAYCPGNFFDGRQIEVLRWVLDTG